MLHNILLIDKTVVPGSVLNDFLLLFRIGLLVTEVFRIQWYLWLLGCRLRHILKPSILRDQVGERPIQLSLESTLLEGHRPVRK